MKCHFIARVRYGLIPMATHSRTAKKFCLARIHSIRLARHSSARWVRESERRKRSQEVQFEKEM